MENKKITWVNITLIREAGIDVLALPIFKQEEPQLSPENDTKLPPFQYVLCTATSPAVKLHEETLTYLNQGRTSTKLDSQRKMAVQGLPGKMKRSNILAPT
ncbi:hypothetical protein lerEdw1_003283 [Lerista edwardsae]|nr:hypothetical protein lerEdw1_003283 [Lerista edwardsae]